MKAPYLTQGIVRTALNATAVTDLNCLFAQTFRTYAAETEASNNIVVKGRRRRSPVASDEGRSRTSTEQQVLKDLRSSAVKGDRTNWALINAPTKVFQLIGDPQSGLADDTTTNPFGETTVDLIHENKANTAHWFKYDYAGDVLRETQRDGRLSDYSKNLMYLLRAKDPKRWTFDALARKFHIRKQRVVAILALKELEAQAIEKGELLAGPLAGYACPVRLDDVQLEPQTAQPCEFFQTQEYLPASGSRSIGRLTGGIQQESVTELGLDDDFLAQSSTPTAPGAAAGEQLGLTSAVSFGLINMMPQVHTTAGAVAEQLRQLLSSYRYDHAALVQSLREQVDRVAEFQQHSFEGTTAPLDVERYRTAVDAVAAAMEPFFRSPGVEMLRRRAELQQLAQELQPLVHRMHEQAAKSAGTSAPSQTQPGGPKEPTPGTPEASGMASADGAVPTTSTASSHAAVPTTSTATLDGAVLTTGTASSDEAVLTTSTAASDGAGLTASTTASDAAVAESEPAVAAVPPAADAEPSASTEGTAPEGLQAASATNHDEPGESSEGTAPEGLHAASATIDDEPGESSEGTAPGVAETAPPRADAGLNASSDPEGLQASESASDDPSSDSSSSSDSDTSSSSSDESDHLDREALLLDESDQSDREGVLLDDSDQSDKEADLGEAADPQSFAEGRSSTSRKSDPAGTLATIKAFRDQNPHFAELCDAMHALYPEPSPSELYDSLGSLPISQRMAVLDVLPEWAVLLRAAGVHAERKANTAQVASRSDPTAALPPPPNLFGATMFADGDCERLLAASAQLQELMAGLEDQVAAARGTHQPPAAAWAAAVPADDVRRLRQLWRTFLSVNDAYDDALQGSSGPWSLAEQRAMHKLLAKVQPQEAATQEEVDAEQEQPQPEGHAAQRQQRHEERVARLRALGYDHLAAYIDYAVVGRVYDRGSGERHYVRLPTFPTFEGYSLEEFDRAGEGELSQLNRLVAQREEEQLFREFHTNLLFSLGLLGEELQPAMGQARPQRPEEGWSYVITSRGDSKVPPLPGFTMVAGKMRAVVGPNGERRPLNEQERLLQERRQPKARRRYMP